MVGNLFRFGLLLSIPVFTLSSYIYADSTLSFAREEGLCCFDAPSGWHFNDTQSLPSSIKLFVQGPKSKEIPPSLTFATENTNLSLAEYLNKAKEFYNSSGFEDWTYLGSIHTDAGPAELVRIEKETEWGPVQMMQAVYMRNQTAYILTASALKEEFPEFYQDFFSSIQSFHIEKNVLEMVAQGDMRHKLETACSQIINSWPDYFTSLGENESQLSHETVARVVFEKEEFQEKQWRPFKGFILKEFQQMGPEWQSQVLNKMQQELMQTNPS